jgi:hypothetical protein
MTDGGFGSKSMWLFLIPDGQYHTYVMDLSLSPVYTGTIKQLRFDPVNTGTTGEKVEIEYISAYPFPGDFNRDGLVDLNDYSVLAANWQKEMHPGFAGDLDNNRKVDVDDLFIFSKYWLSKLEDHTMAWWKFDEASGSIASDIAANQHDGQLVNFPADNSQWITGRVNGALNFDGVNDYVSVPHSSDFDIANCITISAWIKLNDLANYYFVATKQPSGTAASSFSGNFEFRIAPTTGNLEFLHQTSTGATYSQYSSTSGITAGTWTHITVSLIKGNHVRFYINGTLAGYPAQSGTFGIINTEPIRIGTRKDLYTYLNGAIDDVRIYNRALNDEEIKKLTE